MIRPWQIAMIGGGAASLGLLTFFVLKKKREFDVEAERMRRQLTSEMGRGVYAQQLEALRARLATRAEQIANQAADAHIAGAYGLTPERMEGLRRLSQILR